MTIDIGALTRTGKTGTAAAYNSNNFPAIFRQAVIHAFLRACIIKDRHMIQQGTGKSVTIISQGKAVPQSRSRNALNVPFQAQVQEQGNQSIVVEDERYAMRMVADWDEVQQIPDTMDTLVNDLGQSLSRQWDSALLINIMQGGYATASSLGSVAAGFDGGAKVTVDAALAAVTGPQVVKSTALLSAAFDENELDSAGARYMTISPTTLANMLFEKNEGIQNVADTRVGGVGSVGDGNLAKVSNVMLIPSTIISEVNANITAADPNWGDLGQSAAKQQWANSLVGDYRKVIGGAWTKEAVATAVWKDFGVKVRMSGSDSFTDVMGAGFALAKMIYGCNTYRESCCGIIESKTLT